MGFPPLGYPHQVRQGYLRWGTPHQLPPPSQVRWGVPKVGYPPSGTPSQIRWRVPKVGVPEVGYPPSRGYPQLDLAGVPPPGVDRQTDTCQNVTFPSYYAVFNKLLHFELYRSINVTSKKSFCDTWHALENRNVF